MKKSILSAVLAVSMCLILSGIVPAQSSDDTRGAPGMRDTRERQGDLQSLKDEQKATVKSILSKYNASTLTASDARAIHTAFRNAGLRGGTGLNDAVKSAGFDSDKLRDLDPPPDMKGRYDKRTDENEQGLGKSGQDRKQDR